MADETNKTPEGGSGTAPETTGKPGGASLSAEDIVPGLTEAVAQEEAQALEAKLSELEAERDEMKDRLMRALAETENVRKRAEREARDAAAYGGTKLARDLLSVHDNLARALEAADESLREAHPGFLEGVELTHRELLNAFAKHRIEPIDPQIGEKFDPNRHQAMFEAPAPGAQPGTVVQTMQIGFVIADRLLRPALVGVAKAASDAAAGDEAGAEASAGSGGGAGETS